MTCYADGKHVLQELEKKYSIPVIVPKQCNLHHMYGQLEAGKRSFVLLGKSLIWWRCLLLPCSIGTRSLQKVFILLFSLVVLLLCGIFLQMQTPAQGYVNFKDNLNEGEAETRQLSQQVSKLQVYEQI